MENVWDYPRPPALEPVAGPVRIEFAGRMVAATDAAFRVLETSHPPVYYLPRAAFTGCTLEPACGGSFCEWKGTARYWTIRAGDRVAERAAWSHPDPAPAFAAIRDHLAVYAAAMDRCHVGDEAVTPQPVMLHPACCWVAIRARCRGGRKGEHGPAFLVAFCLPATRVMYGRRPSRGQPAPVFDMGGEV